MAANPRSRLGEMLLAEELITEEQLDEALQECACESSFLGHSLVELGYLTEDQLMTVLVRQCRIPHISLTDYDINREVANLIPEAICKSHWVLPVDRLGSMLTVAMVDPLDDKALEAVSGQCDLKVKPVLCSWYDFGQVTRRMFGKETSQLAPPSDPSAVEAAKPAEAEVTEEILDGVGEIEVAEPTQPEPETDEKGKERDTALFSALGSKGSRDDRRKAIKEALLGRGKPLPKEIAGEDGAASDNGLADTSVSEYTFETFIPSESNEFAHKIAKSIAKSPGGDANPFFVYGGVGLGKTHLLTSITNHAMSEHRDSRILSVSSSEFSQQLTEAVETGHMKDFRNKFLGGDILVLDDIQFFAGREQAQEEFFGIFNALLEHGRQIVLAADKHPEELHKIEKRLVSRFVGGIVVGLQPPDWTTRMEILYDRMKRSDVEVAAEVLELIATSIPDDVRKLIGAFRKTVAYCTMIKRDVTAEVAQEILSHLHNTPFN